MPSLGNLRMRPKLIGAFLLVGLVPLATVGMLGLETAEFSLEAESFAKLQAVQAIKTKQLRGFYRDRVNDVTTLAANFLVQGAFIELNGAMDMAGGVASGELAGRGQFDYRAPDDYREIHELYFDTFRKYTEQYGYEDMLFLSSEQGDISFSVSKQSDFGTRTSETESSLREVWRRAAEQGEVALSDIGLYSPAGGAPAQFVAAPIRMEGHVLGVLALRISMSALNEIMQSREGMGATGETYLVGQDGRMRSDSFLNPETHSLVASLAGDPVGNGVDTEAVRLALAGGTGAGVINDYRGEPVLSAY
jgi:methyl-accepting chemotaxis protein